MVSPDEIFIEALDVGKTFSDVVKLTNTMSVPVSVELRPRGSSDRKYEISPDCLRLMPKETQSVVIRTTMVRFPKVGYYIRDVILITSEHFTEKFYISIRPKSYSKPLNESSSSNRKIEKLEDEIRAYDEEIESLHEKYLEKSQTESQLNRLAKENSELKQAIEEADRGSFFSQKLSEMYKEKASVEHLVELRLQEEKEKNDRKNSKILEILKQKDETIENHKKEINELSSKLNDLHTKFITCKKDLERFKNSEQSTIELEKTVQDQQVFIDQLQKQVKDLKSFQLKSKETEVELEKSKKLLKTCQDENSKLKEKEEIILNLEDFKAKGKNRIDSILIEKDSIISELQAKVASQSSFIDTLINNSNSPQEMLKQLLTLESENKQLCVQLITQPNNLPDPDYTKNLEFEISLKNREIINLQNQILSFSQVPTSEQQKNLLLNQQQIETLQKQIDEQQFIISNLESSNKDLQSQLSNLLQGANSETFVQSLASQTQLVSRLNSRVLALKEREDQALKKLSESEELIKELKKVLNGEEVMKKPQIECKSIAVQVNVEQSSTWGDWEKIRYERKIADLDKQLTDFQLKYYEKVKEVHKTITEVSENEVKSIENLIKSQQESSNLSKELEKRNSELNELSNLISQLEAQNEDLKSKKKSADNELEGLENHYKGQINDLELEIQELKLEVSLKDSCIQERTCQVAILMESLENSPNKEDLVIQISHSKAIEGILNRQIIELKGQLQESSFQLSQEVQKSQSLFQKSQTLQSSLDQLMNLKQKQVLDVQNLEKSLKEKNSELNSLKLTLNRLQENEKDYKSRIEIYTQRIQQLQQSFAADLTQEREAFQEELMRIREEAEPFDLELNFHRPLIKSINNLALLAKSSGFRQDFNEKFSKILIESDKQLFNAQRKVKELEFILKSSEHLKPFNSYSIESALALKSQVFELSSELQGLKAPKNMPNPEIYSARIRLLEKDLQERTLNLQQLESELNEARNNNAALSSALSSSKVQKKTEEIFDFLQERSLMLKCEEDLKRKLKSRDQEIQGYLDSHLTKLLIGSPDSNKILDLSREISSLKMIIIELEDKLQAESRANQSLQKSFAELNEINYQNDKQEFHVHVVQNAALLAQLESKDQEIHKLREANEHRKEENAFLQMKISEIKKEIVKTAAADLDLKKKEKVWADGVKELKEKHKREIQGLRLAAQEALDGKIQELEKGVEDNSQRGLEGLQWEEKVRGLKEENERMKEELMERVEEGRVMEGKLVALEGLYNRNREELQVYVAAVQEGCPVRTEEVKTGKKVEKRLVLEKGKSSVVARLVRSLLAAKMGEADYIKQVNKLTESLSATKSASDQTHQKYQVLLSQTEKLLKYLKAQKVPIPDLSLDLDDYFSNSELSRLQEELLDLRSTQFKATSAPLSTQLDPIVFCNSEASDVVESIIFLCNELSSHEQSSSPTLEKVQRLVIRSLHSSLSSFLKPNESLSSILEFKPSHHEDIKLWYVELADSQNEKFSCTVDKLIDFIQKTSVEVSGNLLSTAQYKGAALEIAQNLKSAANELDLLRNLCFMIRTDLTELKGERGFNDYKERAYLAESMKRKLEEEILKIKVEHSYKLAEVQEFASCLKEENEKFNERLEGYVENLQDKDKEIGKLRSQLSRAELELRQALEKYSSLDKTCKDLLEAKEVLVKRNEKLGKDHKGKLNELQEQIVTKDRIVAEVQKQNKILQDERMKIQQETLAAKKQSRDMKTELENIKSLRDNEKEIREMREGKEAKREADELRTDLKRLVDSHKREMEQVLVAVAQLEDKNKKLSSKYKKAKTYITNKVKNREEDTELLKHTFNAQMMTVKNESKERIKDLTAQVYSLQGLLKEKIVETEQEGKKWLEKEEKQKNLQYIELESQRKIAVLEEKLKSQALLFEQESQKLNQELERSRAEHSKLVLKLQDNYTSAEILTDFISKTDLEKKSIESSLKSEISILQRKEREKETLIETLKRKLEETTEKNKSYEQKMFELNSLNKELEDFKYRMNELNNNKAQQRGKIKELENKIRELEAMKETDSNFYNEKYDSIRKEATLAYEEFEKTTARLEGIIEGLKEQAALEAKRTKCTKKAAESIDFMFQVAKRDGLIKALKKEIKMKTVKDKNLTANVDGNLVLLQTQIFKLKGVIKNLESQALELRDENFRLRQEIDLNLKIQEESSEKEGIMRKEFLDRERKHKAEVKAILEEQNRILHMKNTSN